MRLLDSVDHFPFIVDLDGSVLEHFLPFLGRPRLRKRPTRNCEGTGTLGSTRLYMYARHTGSDILSPVRAFRCLPTSPVAGVQTRGSDDGTGPSTQLGSSSVTLTIGSYRAEGPSSVEWTMLEVLVFLRGLNPGQEWSGGGAVDVKWENTSNWTMPPRGTGNFMVPNRIR